MTALLAQKPEVRPPMATNLQNVIEALRIVRKEDTRLTLAGMMVLLDVAANPGSSVTEIKERLGMSMAVASRIIEKFCEPFGKDDDGRRNIWLVQEEGPDRRTLSIGLTPEGKRFVASIKKTLGN